MTRKLIGALLAGACLIATAAIAAEPEPEGAAFVRTDDGWTGWLPHDDEYAEYTVGGDAQPLDATHVQLKPGQGVMLTFADKKDFAKDKNLLEAHRAWELDYWRQQSGKVESRNRDDLAGGRSGLMVTEIHVPGPDGAAITICMVAAAGNNGVFVFAISPVTPQDDSMIKKFAASIKVVHHPLDLVAEAKKYMPGKQGPKAGQKPADQKTADRKAPDKKP